MKVTDTVIVFVRNSNLEHVARGVCTSATMQSILGSASAKGAPESPGRSKVVRARKQGARRGTGFEIGLTGSFVLPGLSEAMALTYSRASCLSQRDTHVHGLAQETKSGAGLLGGATFD